MASAASTPVPTESAGVQSSSASTPDAATVASAKTYTDQSAAQTLSSANTYTDEQTQEALSSAKTYTDAQSTQTLSSANAYTDQAVSAVAGDLAAFEEQTNVRFEQQDKRIDTLGAMSAASTEMAINTAGLAGDNRVGVGAGTYNGQQAASIGYQHMFSDHKASVSVGASFGNGDTSAGVGAGFSW
jgi:hypothetical protein